MNGTELQLRRRISELEAKLERLIELLVEKGVLETFNIIDDEEAT